MNKLAEQYNNIHLVSIGEKLINADYSTLTEKIETNPKPPRFIELQLLSIRIFLGKVTLTIGQEKYLLSILFWKLILGHIKLKA